MTQNFYGDPGGAYDSNVYSIRVDHKISNSNLLFVRFGRTATNGDTYPGQLKEGYGSSTLGNIPGISTVVSDTHTFSATLVNEFKLGFDRTYSATTDYNFGKDEESQLESTGSTIRAMTPPLAGCRFYVRRRHSDRCEQQQKPVGDGPEHLPDNRQRVLVRGPANIKFGVDIRRLQVNNLNKPLTIRGSYTFDDRLSGLAYANFLLGYPSGSTRGIARPNAYTRSTFSGFCIQDDESPSAAHAKLRFALRVSDALG